jgi:hypothetical protein
MIQYPDSIAITVSASATQNASGFWTAGASAEYTFSCRAEMNGVGRKIAGDDGALMDYAFEVYMPQTTTIIPRDSDYVLTSLLNGIITGKVKRASNGQLNSRLWL